MKRGNPSQRRLMGQKDGQTQEQRERKKRTVKSHSEHQTRSKGKRGGKTKGLKVNIEWIVWSTIM